MFNIVNSDNYVLHSFSEEENANKYIELSKNISNEYLEVEEEEIKENLDLKIVEIITIVANLKLNQTITMSDCIKKIINIDVVEETKSIPIFLGGIYEYKVIRVLPSLTSKRESYIKDLKESVNNQIIKDYNDYVLLNNLKNVFSLSLDEIAFLNKIGELHKEICDINNKFVEESKDEDLQFQLLCNLDILEDISILESMIDNVDTLKKYEEYKKLMKEYDIFKEKYKFKL